MSFIDWNEEIILNHPTMDKEHKQMVDDTNELHTLILNESKEEALTLFKKISSDLKHHFDTEERLMKESKIIFYISHKLEHERYYNKITSLLSNIESGKTELSIEHLDEIKLWLFNHLKFKDKKLAAFLIENNIG